MEESGLFEIINQIFLKTYLKYALDIPERRLYIYYICLNTYMFFGMLTQIHLVYVLYSYTGFSWANKGMSHTSIVYNTYYISSVIRPRQVTAPTGFLSKYRFLSYFITPFLRHSLEKHKVSMKN